MKKFNIKTFLICLVLVLSLTLSVVSPVLYFVIGDNKKYEQVAASPCWYDGVGVPAGNIGVNGDYYLDTAGGAVYQKFNSIWKLIYKVGSGEQGPAGQDGNAIKTGTEDPNSADIDGLTGDLYLNTETGDLYEMLDNGHWELKSNIKGKDGASWLFGDYDIREYPHSAEGKIGDFYLNTTDGELYKKTGESTWERVGNLKGKVGETGPAGTNGATWKFDSGDPTSKNIDGNKGDFYLDEESLDIWYFRDSEWEKVGNIKGENGATWKVDSGTPNGSVHGKIGDLYLDTDDWKVYKNTDGNTTWESIGSIQGKEGEQGLTGKDGATWKTGSGIPNDSVSGNEGDLYLDTSNGDIYKNTNGDKAWSHEGSIKGTNGEPGLNGKDGATWKVDEGNPEGKVADAKAGDFYVDKTTLDVWYYSGSSWEKLGNIKSEAEEKVAPTWTVGNQDPTDGGVEGKEGDVYLDSSSMTLYQYTESSWNSLGSIKGNDGKDGNDMYMGYDGYIWNGPVRSDWYVPGATVGENVFERTIEVAEVMKKYFDGDYIDLTNSYVALMPYYQENSNVTLYSGMQAVEITVYAKEAGDLQIGTAKVNKIVDAKKNGSGITIINETTHQVVQGKNVIEVKIDIDDDETILLGGNGSVGLYYAKNIPVDDEMGNFTVVQSAAKSGSGEVISKSGEYDDTLAIQVKVTLTADLPIFEDLKQHVEEDLVIGDEKGLLTLKKNTAIEEFGPFMYGYGITTDHDITLTNLFEGKKISKISVPVNNLEMKNGLPYLDMYIIPTYKKENGGTTPPPNQKDGSVDVVDQMKASDFLEKYKSPNPLRINSPSEFSEELNLLQEVHDGETTYHIGWVDFDCDYVIPDGYTLAFCGSGGGVDWIYANKDDEKQSGVVDKTHINNNPYYDKLRFVGMMGKDGYNGEFQKHMMFFDVYYEVSWSFEQQIERLEELEYKASELAKLREILGGKHISILGDSISTYEGYSNEYETQNSDIKNNGGPYSADKEYNNGGWSEHNKYGNWVTYHGENLGVTSVDKTWWMRTIRQVNMELCVNNSFTGDSVTTEAERSNMRCTQLHDNTTSSNPNQTIADQNQEQSEEIYPDIVALYMGINDFNYTQELTPESFGKAYKTVVEKIITTYKDQSQNPDNFTVFVFTLLPNGWGQTSLSKIDGADREAEYLTNLEKLNDQIRQIAKENPNVEVVDLFSSLNFTRESIKPYTGDGLHPNAEGMRLISNCFIRALYKKFCNK